MKYFCKVTVPVLLGFLTIAGASISTWRDIPVIKDWISEIQEDERDTTVDVLEPPIVSIKNGSIQGQTRYWGANTTVYRYLGIPYAKAPIKELRFEPPQPHNGWVNETLKATRHPPACPQLGTSLNLVNEDCLFLSIYTPRKPGQEGPPLPVIYFIHGGGLMFGQNLIYRGGKLIKSDEVVFVTIQYRLGALGFLSTGDDAISSNNGMKDMVQGLRWVQENIAAFGGDPNQVTIAGESAGGISVIYLVLSPLARGLFHGAIAMSGTPLIDLAIDRNPRESADRLAKPLNCTRDSSAELVACLKEKSWGQLIASGLGMIAEDFSKFKIVLKGTSPVIEGNVPGAFLPDDPLKIMREGEINDVPLILGAVQHEGSMALAGVYFMLNSEGLFDDPIYMQDKFFGHILTTYGVDDSINGASISGSLAAEFLKPGADRTNFTDMQYEILDMLSAVFLKAPIQRTADILSRRLKSVYLYSFEHYGKLMPMQSVYDVAATVVKTLLPGSLPPMKSAGICHADDLLYIFDMMLKPTLPNDIKFAQTFTKLLTNFVAHGNPTPEASNDYPDWDKYNPRLQNYMKLTIPFEHKNYYPGSWKQGVPGALGESS